MAQTPLTRVLDDLKSLRPEELQQVEKAVQERLESAGYSPEEGKAMQALVEAGLLKEIKPHRAENRRDYPLVSIQGKPLSETILEERR